jgi:hypothetical protein
MSGLVITLGGAAVIFLFTQYERNPDGSLNFKVPHNYIKGKYYDAKYFENVSVYFSHELFDLDSSLGRSTTNKNLLRLFDINDIRHGHGVDRLIKLEFDQSDIPTIQKFIIWENNITQELRAKECFSLDRTRKQITLGSNCTSYISTKSNQILFIFRFIQPNDLKLIFGDITYNINVKNNSSETCKPPDFEIRNDIIDYSKVTEAALHYYRTLDVSKRTYSLIHTSDNNSKFYNSKDLQDIEDVWKTGFVYCKSTGRLAPHRDNSIVVPCL